MTYAELETIVGKILTENAIGQGETINLHLTPESAGALYGDPRMTSGAIEIQGRPIRIHIDDGPQAA